MFFAIAFAIVGTLDAHACKCGELRTVEKAIESVAFVIVGTPISQENLLIFPKADAPDDFNKPLKVIKYNFLVHTKYKGEVSEKTISLYTTDIIGMCGLKLELNKNYIYYGDIHPNPFLYEYFQTDTGKNVGWIERCGRTQLFNTQEITEIEEYLEPQAI